MDAEESKRPTKSSQKRARPAPLPDLRSRETRIVLLLTSYLDAVESSGDGARGDAFASRMPGRNLYLWPRGSYEELEDALDAMRGEEMQLYRAVWARWVVKLPHVNAKRSEKGLQSLAKRMPRTINVPKAIAENAGHEPALARNYARRFDK